MKVSGTSVLPSPPHEVWRALNDPAVLVQAIPGCQRLEALGGDAYKMTVAAGVGAIKGVYDGEVHLSDHQEPYSFRMHCQGAGAPGTIGAEVLVMLAEGADGGTSLSYDADAVVGGTIGGVGQRMLTGVSKKMAEEFFCNVQALLAGLPAAGGLPSPAGLREEGAPPNQAPSFVGSPPGPSTVAAPSSLRPAPEFGAPPAGVPVTGGRAAPQPGAVFTAPTRASGGAGQQLGFLVGAAVGAAAALAGVVVGAWITGRRRR